MLLFFPKKTSNLKEKSSSQPKAKRADPDTCQLIYNLLDPIANLIPSDQIVHFSSKCSAKGWSLYAEIENPDRLQAMLILKERWRADTLIAVIEGEKFLKAKIMATEEDKKPTIVVFLNLKEIENNLTEVQNSIKNIMHKLDDISARGISRSMSILSLSI